MSESVLPDIQCSQNEKLEMKESTDLFLLIENPKKSNNLGPILRCAAAYAVKQVVFVGYEKCSTEGSHGAAKHLDIISFPTFQQACDYLRKPQVEGGCNVTSILGLLGGKENGFNELGYELTEDENNHKLVTIVSESQTTVTKSATSSTTTFLYPKSFPVHLRQFSKGNCCFLISKNWRGLPQDQARFCDSFVHVPYDPVPFITAATTCEKDDQGSASIMIPQHNLKLLDVPSCLSITLHHFTAWAKYDQRMFTKHKFDVSLTQKGSILGSAEQIEKTTKRLKRKKDLEEEANNVQLECTNHFMFGNNSDY